MFIFPAIIVNTKSIINYYTMKILEIITSLAPGGGERFVTDLTNEIGMYKDHTVKLLSIKDINLANNGFYYKDLDKKIDFQCLKERKFSFLTAFKVFKAIRNNKPNIVHIHLSSTLNACFLAILLYRKPLYVQTLHGRADKQIASFFDKIIKNTVYKLGLVKLITISDSNNKSFQDFFRRKSDGIIYNGRQELIISNREKVKDEISKYMINDETVVFTHVARFHPEKNQKLLINSFNKIINRGANAVLLIIGDGFDSEEGKKLKELACNSIYFLGLKNNVGDYLVNSDAFVLSSLNEAMPISLIEALSCKCIPLSTPVSGSIDIIKNGVNGFISKDFTEESFINMLCDFLENRKNINKEEIYDLYVKQFSITTCAKKYISFFENKSRN